MPRSPNTPCSVCGKLCWPSGGRMGRGNHVCRACKRIPPSSEDPYSGKHGKTTTYRKGCRCEECRGAVRAYVLAYKARTGSWPNKKVEPPAHCSGCGERVRCRYSDKPLCKRCKRSLNLSKSERLALYARDGYRCGICAEAVDITIPNPDPWAPTLDHIVPRSRGGSDDSANLRLTHRWCNTIRGNREWLTLDEVA